MSVYGGRSRMARDRARDRAREVAQGMAREVARHASGKVLPLSLVCRRCGRPLTSEASQRRGYGAACWLAVGGRV